MPQNILTQGWLGGALLLEGYAPSAATTAAGLTFFAAGRDITSYVDLDYVLGQNDLTQRIDILSFRLVQAPLGLLDDKTDVWVTDQSGVRWFGGVVGQIDRVSTSPELVWDVQAQGYAALLDTAVVNRVYNAQTDAAIIADLLAAYRPEISLVAPDVPITLDHLAFPYKPLSTAIDTICKHTGCRYYVDPDKVLHYFNPRTLSPVLVFTDLSPNNATQWSYETWKLESDATQVQNRVVAIGDKYLAPSRTESFTGDGQRTVFTLAHRPHKTESVSVGGLAQAVGTWGIDGFVSGGPQVLVDAAQQAVHLQTAPAAGVQVQVTYDYETPVIARASSSASYAQYGRWYDGAPIRDSSMLSVATALARCQTVLAQYAFAPRTVYLRTRAPWTRSGQAVLVTNTPDGVSAEQFIIQQIRWRPTGGGVVVCDLQLIG